MPSLITNVENNSEKSSQTFRKDLIYYCSGFNVGTGGGVETYLTSIFNYQTPSFCDRVIKSLDNIDQIQFKLLHFHSEDLLLQLTGKCPAVFTVHNHAPYCPSGTKYLAGNEVICDRNFSFLGCTWGQIIDGCGSRRPKRVIYGLQHSDRVLNLVKKFKVILIANSDYVRGQLIKNGIPPQQTVTLRYGTPFPQIATAPLTVETHKNQRILFAGRIVPDKGLEWLLKTLVHTSTRIHLDIAGEGWDKPRLEKLADMLGLSGRITWHGWCNTDKMNALYQECFAVIFPSVWPEPAGLITLEANARYRPVIASAVGGIPEHVRDGETGFLVPANNVQKLAQAITNLSEDYQKCRLLGQQAHTLFTTEFTMDVHIKNLQKIYNKAISEFVI